MKYYEAGDRVAKLVLKVGIVIVSGLLFGFAGLILGTYIGGNFAEDFVFNGVRGYEAAGQLGFILGSAMGILVGILFMRNWKKG